jgi:sulfide:quinone oxidoreductase
MWLFPTSDAKQKETGMDKINDLNEEFSTCGQIYPQDLTKIAASGFRTVICNRPDEESPEQPNFTQIESAASACGLQFAYLPVIPGKISDADVMAFSNALTRLPSPVLAYCRTGNRSRALYERVQRRPTRDAASDLLGVKKADALRGADILIVGGGAAGIGLASSLLKRQPGLQITLVEPSDQHYYQPAWTLVGVGEYDIQKTVRPMAGLIPEGVEWLKVAVESFEPERRQVVLSDGRRIEYRNLVVAAGLKIDWDGIEGLGATLGKNGVTSNYRFDLAPYTWSLVKALKAGKAIFTQPVMPIKCAGAPQKAMYLSCSYWEKIGVLDKIDVEFDNAGGVLFGVPTFVAPLMEYVKRYRASLQFNSTLVAVDGPARKAWFSVKNAAGETSRIEKSFDLLHVVPPQVPHDFVRGTPLANADGWVEVDQKTLRHTRFPDVFSLGDACSAPNAKTAAAVRKQIVVVAENILAARAGSALPLAYDGYGSCPLTVEIGKVILAEFGYGGKLLPTFPLDPTVPRHSAWILKKNMLPAIYWNAMLKGREWLARPAKE